MKNIINEYKKIIDENMDIYLKKDEPTIIWDAMRYSIFAGGKRLRPIFVLETAKQCNNNRTQIKEVLPVACALEMIHVQSLIHDDLPCMDNDDYRRGKPTNHRVFGEANAVLAGDALISHAVTTIIKNCNLNAEIKLRLIDEVMTAAGAKGIIAGQVVDIASEGKTVDENTLNFIHKYKTAMMFRAAIRCGAICANVEEEKLNKLTEFANIFGLAFQIKDDILDVTSTLEELGKTPGKDKTSNKATYVNIYGLEEAIKKLNSLCDKSYDIIKQELGDSELFKYYIQKLKVNK